MAQNTCEKCNVNVGKVRVDLGINVGEEMLKSMEILMNRIDCAQQAMSPASIPTGIDKDKAAIFVKTAIELYADYRMLQKEWWSAVKKQYKLGDDKEIYVDLTNGDLYTFEDCSQEKCN